MSKLSIRFATPYDIWPLEALMGEALDEAGGTMPPYDPTEAAHSVIELARAGMILVAVEAIEGGRERIVGAIVSRLSSWSWCSSYKYIDVFHFFVSKSARTLKLENGKLVADGLLEAVTVIATDAGLPLHLEHLFPGAVAEKERFFSARGFRQLGGAYVFHPPQSETASVAAE